MQGYRIIVVVSLLALGACRSEPIRYHTLSPASAATGDSVSAITVQSVTVPPQVDRTQIVLRENDSHLVPLESDWWGAPLADELKNALVIRMAAPAGENAPTTAVAVRVDVRRFDSVPGRYALIDAQWWLSAEKNGRRESHSCAAQLRSDADDSIDSLVAAQQQNINRLAQRIAQSAARWLAGGDCF